MGWHERSNVPVIKIYDLVSRGLLTCTSIYNNNTIFEIIADVKAIQGTYC